MEENNQDKIYYINVDDILPNRFQPRIHFDEKELNELASSILKYGIIQPIVLRKINDKYEIIAGERRYKAACLAGLKTIPAIINNTDDNTSAEIALLENLQRKNLTVIEEAQSYKKLMDRGFTQEDIANKLGISQSSIANKLRLLSLPKEVRDALLYNQISERHARSLLSLNNEDLQRSLLNKIINERLTVKQTEDEISMLLMKDLYKKEDNSIPENIQRFLNPDPVKVEEKPKQEIDEILSFNIPNNVDIENKKEKLSIKESSFEEIKGNNENGFKEVISNEESINPFVNNKISENNIEELPLENEEEHDSRSFLEQFNDKKDITNIINDIRDYINKLNEKGKVVTSTELDLNNKYQIIIEIDKDTM